MNVLMILGQLNNLMHELVGMFRLWKERKLFRHTSGQNYIDLVAILFNMVYCILRIKYPFGSILDMEAYE